MTLQISSGQIIQAPFLPGPAEVKTFVARQGYYRLECVLLNDGNRYLTKNLQPAQLEEIAVVQRNALTKSKSAEDFFCYIEANRIRLAYQFDPQLAVSISQVDPLPHQIEAVYHHVLQSPRIRFLIADDPGAGKTIMAGLVIKELQYRRMARRVLIVAPGHLKYQWQREMKERFSTSFSIVDRGRIESSWGENVWEERDLLITSIDFVKQDSVLATLQTTRWDLVIVDEAHKMSAYSYQGRSQVKVDKTKRYRVGETLSRYSNHMLFLTATPHRGDDENFRLFLDLLRPGFFAQTELLRESVAQKDNPVFIRRLKEDMKRFDGRRIFPDRHVQSVHFRLTDDERELYNAVTDYVRDYYDKVRENRSISFALMILQRRLASSINAIHRSLTRRKERLEELLLLPEKIRNDEDYLRAQNITEDDLSEMSEEDRLIWEQRLEHLSLAANIGDVEAEIEQLERLIGMANVVRREETESKLIGLRDKVLSQLGDRKLLIFTEFRDTVNYLVEKLQDWGYSVITIHGEMGMDARIAAEHEFKHNAQIMVATEAAGEGINLQFCSWMVNYDIPWNPNRLEQRMGRIHRYGQQYEVYIYNMITQDTREGAILDRIFGKLDAMRNALGHDRVFDIIGDIIPETRLDELIKDAILNQRRMEEIEQQIDAVDVAHAERTLEQAFLMSLATRHIDYTGILREKLEAEENRLVPEYVEDYFVRAYQRLGGRIEKRAVHDARLYTVSNVPFELRKLGEDYEFKTAYGAVQRDYRQIVFDKKAVEAYGNADFVAPGHPLLEAVNTAHIARMDDSRNVYAVFGDPTGVKEGLLWFVQGQINDGSGQPAGNRVFCLYQAANDTIQVMNPAILWDLQPLDDFDAPAELTTAAGRRDEIEDFIITDILFPFRDEIEARRRRETEIKEKYGLRSIEHLIQESNGKVMEYELRQLNGENVGLPLLNEQRNLDTLRLRKEELMRELELERNLTVDEPHILGVAIVVPLEAMQSGPTPAGPHQVNDVPRGDYGPDTGVDPDRLHEIELVGMRIALAYEQENGRRAEDVAHENHGFDLRSLRYDDDGALADVRYIEVKARAQSGAIRLSSNEWKKARRYGDQYWLFVVTHAATESPRLSRIQNPAAQFQMDEDIFATGYLIPEDRWHDVSGI